MLLAKHSTYFVSVRSCFANCRVSISASGTTAGPLQQGNSIVGSCHKATKASHLTQHHPPTHNPPHPTNHPFQQRAQGRPCRGWGKNGEEIRRTRKGSGGSRRRGGSASPRGGESLAGTGSDVQPECEERPFALRRTMGRRVVWAEGGEGGGPQSRGGPNRLQGAARP